MIVLKDNNVTEQRKSSGSLQRLVLLWLPLLAITVGYFWWKKPTWPKPTSATYFKTHWQDESQYIVESILTDLVEMIHYARHSQLASPQTTTVSATENSSSVYRAPVYDVEIKIKKPTLQIKQSLKVDGPIWDPKVYTELTAALAKEEGLSGKTSDAPKEEVAATLQLLKSLNPVDLEHENRALSEQLAKDFTNPRLHERAALLLSLFALRESSGRFYDVRTPLCRMTAHLALANHLSTQAPGPTGRLAHALLWALMNNQAEALQKLNQLEASQPDWQLPLAALKARVTTDHRYVQLRGDSSPLEWICWFHAQTRAGDGDYAWKQVSDSQKKTRSDYCRMANVAGTGVETGHQLLRLSLPLEMKEISEVYSVSHTNTLNETNLVLALDQLPDRCITANESGAPEVRVIGWGQWAMFLQRHLCHAMTRNYDFLENQWGVHEEAKKFSRQCDGTFGDLRLYPFVQRFNCDDSASYRKSVDDGFAVTVATPHLVSPGIWNYLCYKGPNRELYKPNPNPHVNEWHRHNPPPGTVYNSSPRFDHPSLVRRPDVVAQLENLQKLAPWEYDVAFYLSEKKYHGQATFEQERETYRSLLEFSEVAMVQAANAAEDRPEEFEKLVSAAAKIEPSRYFRLGNYFADKDQAKAAHYFQLGIQKGDSVSGSTHAPWLVKYLLSQGKKEEARQLADWAAEVYSYNGLKAKAQYLELIGQPAGAYEFYKKIQERYGSASELVAFCFRQRAGGDARYEAAFRKGSSALFPGGIEQVQMKDFSDAPPEGVIVNEVNSRVRKAGLKFGDVIVAVSGIRVRTLDQYLFAANLSLEPTLVLIFWNGRSYTMSKASPPEHTFHADFQTYQAPASQPVKVSARSR